MKTNKIHLTYALSLPFDADSNSLSTLFDLLDQFESIERMRILDLTCCVFDIHVPLEYRDDDELCDEMYWEFKKRCKLLSYSWHDFIITYVVVLLVLSTLRYRADPAVGRHNEKKMRDTVKWFQKQIDAKLINRKTAEFLMMHCEGAANNEAAEVGLSRMRYDEFCRDVVAHLL